MSRWFRHYAGMMRDDKLVRVAVKSKQPVERVVWVYGAILESASEINDAGRYEFDAGEAAYFLRCDEHELVCIVECLNDLGRLSGGMVVRWDDRQFNSDSAKERQRRYRERRKAGSHVQERDNDVGETSPNVSRDVTQPSRYGQVTAQETDTETKKEDANASKTRASKSDFETWYWHYPHKVQRGAAEKAFFKARHFASIEELIAGVQRYIASKPIDRQWQNPATWLNGKGWLDAPAPAPRPHSTASPPPGKRMNAVEANLARRIRRNEPEGGRRDNGDAELLPPDRPGLPDFVRDAGKSLTWDG
jgi:hypothetical protein